MSPEAQRISIAESCGWEWRRYEGGAGSLHFGWFSPHDDKVHAHSYKREGKQDNVECLPNYLSDRNALFSALRHHGIHDPANLDIRVKYINTLREIVGRRMPKNKSGSPLTSDVDLLMAENEEIREALLRTIKKWKP